MRLLAYHMKRCILYSFSELQTIKIACLLAKFSKVSCSIYLYSEIGLGKTSFCRGFLRALGYLGHVRSPSYSLVESYTLTSLVVHHFDLYRLRSIEELEYIGIRDYFDCHSLRLVEWPNLMRNILPKEDISVHFDCCYSLTRKITLEAFTSLGEFILEKSFGGKNAMYAETKI